MKNNLELYKNKLICPVRDSNPGYCLPSRNHFLTKMLEVEIFNFFLNRFALERAVSLASRLTGLFFCHGSLSFACRLTGQLSNSKRKIVFKALFLCRDDYILEEKSFQIIEIKFDLQLYNEPTRSLEFTLFPLILLMSNETASGSNLRNKNSIYD